MANVINKLNLNDEDRMVEYFRGEVSCKGEIRQFDPIVGFLSIYDYFRNETVEFLYRHEEDIRWRGTGEQNTFTCDWYYDDDEVPVARSEDKVSAATISRL
jgi:hypothetical protein